MKRILHFTPLICSIVFSGAVAMGVDLDSYTSPNQGPKVASAMRPYGEEATAAEGYVAEEEPEKWLSGSVVGSWADGFGQVGDRWQFNQVWMTIQKSADTNLPYDFGYHFDAVFGTNNLQCAGDGGFDGKWGVSGDGYAASLYQAYLEASIGKLSGKFGKFGTLLGYESVDASANAFATHSHMFNNEPATHSGGLFTWAPADALELNVGLVAGADNSWQNYRGDSGFLFGATLNLDERVSISYASELLQTHSELGENRAAQSWGYYELGGFPIGDQNEYLQTVTAELKFTDQLSYAFTTNYGTMEDRATKTHRYNQYGFANYLTYAFTDCFSTALRYEYYLRELDSKGMPAGYVNLPDAEKVKGKYHDVSFALTYKPVENIFILPEIRYDWVNAGGFKDNGVTGAVAFGIVY